MREVIAKFHDVFRNSLDEDDDDEDEDNEDEGSRGRERNMDEKVVRPDFVVSRGQRHGRRKRGGGETAVQF